jgi:RNA polymerase sigma-70 factor (ECF subfamily)
MAKRRARSQPSESPDTDESDSAGDDPRDSFSLDLRAALATLSEEERAAALLCDAAGFSHAEAARVMGAPLGSVKTYVARARERLRAALSADDDALSA